MASRLYSSRGCKKWLRSSIDRQVDKGATWSSFLFEEKARRGVEPSDASEKPNSELGDRTHMIQVRFYCPQISDLKDFYNRIIDDRCKEVLAKSYFPSLLFMYWRKEGQPGI